MTYTLVQAQLRRTLRCIFCELDPKTNTGDFSCHACHFAEGEDKK